MTEQQARLHEAARTLNQLATTVLTEEYSDYGQRIYEAASALER
jgi:hypothetical protein